MPKTLHDHKYLEKEFYKRTSIIEELCINYSPPKTVRVTHAEQDDNELIFFMVEDSDGNSRKLSDGMFKSLYIESDDYAQLCDVMDKEIEKINKNKTLLLDYFIKGKTDGFRVVMHK